jgi:molybdopterin-containing oxidoreductase family membrane subunit
MLSLFMDIGRPDRFWHPVVFWNVHSVLWEITLAVMLYTTVLVLEFVPIAIESLVPKERFHFLHSLGHFLHRIMPIIALIGMSISMIHQSSLGATYGILTARPIWFSPSAPVMFILSAIAGGPALTLFLTLIAGVILNKQMVPQDVIKGVAKLIGFAALAYLYLKLWSWLSTSYYSRVPEREMGMELLNLNTPYGFTFWWGEVLLGAIVPAIIMLWPRLRNNRYILMFGCALVILGLLIYRWNMTLAGFTVPLQWNPGVREIGSVNVYTPSLVEWGVALGIVCYGSLAFTLGVRFLRLYPEAKPLAESIAPVTAPESETQPPAPQPQPSGAD